MPGMVEQLVWNALLENGTIVHEKGASGYVVGKAHVVRDNQHGHLLLGQQPDNPLHFAHHGGVER